MKILAVDTSTNFLCLAAYDDGKIAEYNLDLNRKHSNLLLVTIKRVINCLKWGITDIDYFACGTGPGSFTGVRIAVSTIKGLSYCLKKPVLGISTLDILARNARHYGIIVPAMDAKRNLIYCSMYDNSKGQTKRIAPYMLLSLDEFLKKIKPDSVILGDAAGLYKQEMLKGIKGAVVLDKDYWFPRGGNIIYFALSMIKDKKFKNSFDIKPIYLYPKECQIKSAK